MKIKNWTPHPIHIYRMDCDKILVTIDPSGEIVRLLEEEGMEAVSLWLPMHRPEVRLRYWDMTENYTLSVPCITRSLGMADCTIPCEDDVLNIIPILVLNALEPRCDLCSPDFGDGAVRSIEGSVIGTRRLIFKMFGLPIDSGFASWTRWRGSREKQDSENPLPEPRKGAGR